MPAIDLQLLPAQSQGSSQGAKKLTAAHIAASRVTETEIRDSWLHQKQQIPKKKKTKKMQNKANPKMNICSVCCMYIYTRLCHYQTSGRTRLRLPALQTGLYDSN